jgi:hypothetical protein
MFIVTVEVSCGLPSPSPFCQPKGREFDIDLGRQIFLTSKFSPAFWFTQTAHLLAKMDHTAGTRPLMHCNIANSPARIMRAAVF